MDLLIEARERAVEVLQRCSSPIGFKASGLTRGYPHVWARDSIITALGAAWAEPTLFLPPFRASLDTLGAFQSPLGLIPLNVDVASRTVSTENAGAVDANLWFILGHYYYWLLSHDDAYLRDNFARLQRALVWLRYQDMNECGLLEVPEAGDWMDLLSVRYNVLYDNVLYFASLHAFAQMAAACGAEAGG
ncbi:MAG: GH116 family glycosyl hydrolase, partial [Anaerolineae bacterium]